MILPPFNELVSGAGKVFPPSYHQTAERSPLVTDHDHQYRGVEAQPAPFANAGPPGVGIPRTYVYDYGYDGHHLQQSWVQQPYPVYGTPFSYGQPSSTWLRSRGM